MRRRAARVTRLRHTALRYGTVGTCVVMLRRQAARFFNDLLVFTVSWHLSVCLAVSRDDKPDVACAMRLESVRSSSCTLHR